jgi:hypothetical protein
MKEGHRASQDALSPPFLTNSVDVAAGALDRETSTASTSQVELSRNNPVVPPDRSGKGACELVLEAQRWRGVNQESPEMNTGGARGHEGSGSDGVFETGRSGITSSAISWGDDPRANATGN